MLIGHMTSASFQGWKREGQDKEARRLPMRAEWPDDHLFLTATPSPHLSTSIPHRLSLAASLSPSIPHRLSLASLSPSIPHRLSLAASLSPSFSRRLSIE